MSAADRADCLSRELARGPALEVGGDDSPGLSRWRLLARGAGKCTIVKSEDDAMRSTMITLTVTHCPSCGSALPQPREHHPGIDTLGPLVCDACAGRLAAECGRLTAALHERFPNLPRMTQVGSEANTGGSP